MMEPGKKRLLTESVECSSTSQTNCSAKKIRLHSEALGDDSKEIDSFKVDENFTASAKNDFNACIPDPSTAEAPSFQKDVRVFKTTSDQSGWTRSFPNDTRCQQDPNLNEEIPSFRSLGTFPSHPPTRFLGGAPVNFREPLKVGEFSIDPHRRFHNDASAKKYYVHLDSKRPLNMDLKKGVLTFARVMHGA